MAPATTSETDGTSPGLTNDPVQVVVHFRVGQWDGRQVHRAMSRFPDYTGLHIIETTSKENVVNHVAGHVPHGLRWSSSDSPLRYSPLTNSKQTELLLFDTIDASNDLSLFEILQVRRQEFQRRQAVEIRARNLYQFHLWVYTTRVTQSRNVIQRATTQRIATQIARIQEFNVAHPSQALGRLETAYTARTMARNAQNDSNVPLTTETLPAANNTTRQLSFLDQRMANVATNVGSQQNFNQPVPPNDLNLVAVWCVMNGAYQKIFIDINGLREALNLPQFNLNGIENFTDPIIPHPSGPDQPDVDHEDN
jgi:hypothetical protein